MEKFVAHPKVARGAGQGPEQGQREVRTRKGCRWTCARLPEESYGAALQYFTGSKEHSVALRQRAQKMGLTLNEYGLARIDTKEPVAQRDRRGDLPGAGPRLDSAGAARESGRNRSRRVAQAAEAGGAEAHSRRSAHAHARERRPRHARRNGRSGARAGLRIRRHHGSFESPGDGQRPGREARRRLRAPGARNGSERASGCACSPASSATSAATARWIWKTTRWASWIW